jgi:hypothetical protein
MMCVQGTEACVGICYVLRRVTVTLRRMTLTLMMTEPGLIRPRTVGAMLRGGTLMAGPLLDAHQVS